MSWFVERKLCVPYSNIWNFDRGKLVILSVFIEYYLLETIVKGNSQATKVVRRIRSELDKIRILPAIKSFSKEIYKKAYFSANAAKVWDHMQSFEEEGEEYFIHPCASCA